MAITTRLEVYEIDGKPYDGFFAVDDSIKGPRPSIISFHAFEGRTAENEENAVRLAKHGYAVMAADVYGVGVRGNSMEESGGLMMALVKNRPEFHKRIMAALDVMTKQEECNPDKVVSIGYCFGGLSALDMARINAPIAGVVAIHPAFFDAVPGHSDPIQPKVLALLGYEDPMEGPENQQKFADEMTGRKADWQLHLYGGVVHAFTKKSANNPEMGVMYNESADRRSWNSMLNFLSETIGGQTNLLS